MHRADTEAPQKSVGSRARSSFPVRIRAKVYDVMRIGHWRIIGGEDERGHMLREGRGSAAVSELALEAL